MAKPLTARRWTIWRASDRSVEFIGFPEKDYLCQVHRTGQCLYWQIHVLHILHHRCFKMGWYPQGYENLTTFSVQADKRGSAMLFGFEHYLTVTWMIRWKPDIRFRRTSSTYLFSFVFWPLPRAGVVFTGDRPTKQNEQCKRWYWTIELTEFKVYAVARRSLFGDGIDYFQWFHGLCFVLEVF